MKGTRILVTSKPRGVFEYVYIASGRTPKPGTCMEIKPSTAHVSGCFTYQEYGVQAHSSGHYIENDGDRKAIAILVEKDDEGMLYSAAYTAGDMAKIYWPAMGEQFNMILENQTGTGSDTLVIGNEMMVDNGTGKLLEADNDAQAHPFTILEATANVTADVWVWCRFNGEGGA